MKRVQHWLEYAAIRLTIGVFALVPLSWARRMGSALGALGYWPLGIRRRVVTRQLAAAFPGLADREVQRLARDAYRHLGRVTVESALAPRLGPQGVLSLIEWEDDMTPIRELMAKGRGSILVTAHFGNWEFTAAWAAARGLPVEVVARRQANRVFDAWITRTREALGFRVIHDQDATRRIPVALKQGHVVGIVADQSARGIASTYVPFFGRPAKTPRGPAVYARKYGLPIYFVTAIAQPSGKYRVHIEPVPVSVTGDREADVDATVAAYSRQLERLVRRYPAQYFWHHRRWRRQPPDTPAELREPR